MKYENMYSVIVIKQGVHNLCCALDPFENLATPTELL